MTTMLKLIQRMEGRDLPAPAATAPEGFGDTVPREAADHLVSLLSPDSFEADQYRVLRHRLERICSDRDRCLLAVTSPAAGDGKTTTAINLAAALAESADAGVLLIDMDLRLARTSAELGLAEDGRPGLVEAIQQPWLSLPDVVRPMAKRGLSVLPAGRALPSPHEILQSARLGDLLNQARRSYRFVVVDTPPILPVPDGRLVACWIDAYLVVISAHRTGRALLEETLNSLEPGKVVGLVFNNADPPEPGLYGSYYKYKTARDTAGRATAPVPGES